MADDDLLDNSPDDDEGGDTGIDLEGSSSGGTRSKGTPPDDEDDEGLDDEDDQPDDDTAKKPAGKTYTQADIDKLQGSLRAAREEARNKIGALRKQVRTLTAAQTQNSGDGDDAVAKAREEAAADAVKHFKPIAVRAAAKAAFLENHLQNPNDKRINRLVRNLDMDEIEVDPDDGSIIGLDEQIAALVEEFAEMFGEPPAATEETPKPKPKPVRGDGSNRPAAPATPDKNKNTGAYLADRILKSTGGTGR